MSIRKEILTSKFVLEFNPDNWNFRRSSGYPGYDYFTLPNDEQTWIYEDEYIQARILQAEIQSEKEFLLKY